MPATGWRRPLAGYHEALSSSPLLLLLPPDLERGQLGLGRQDVVDGHADGEVQGHAGGACRAQPRPLRVFERHQCRAGQRGPQLGALLVLPGQVALVAPSLARGGLLGTCLRGLPGLRVIGRQRLGEVGQDAAEKLGLVGGLGGRLLRIGEEKMRFGCAMLRQELPGVRQFFGMGRALGAAMKALVEGVPPGPAPG